MTTSIAREGIGSPPRVRPRPVDPGFVSATQLAQIVSGAPLVLIDGKPAATTESQAACCGVPGGTCVPSVFNVTIG